MAAGRPEEGARPIGSGARAPGRGRPARSREGRGVGGARPGGGATLDGPESGGPEDSAARPRGIPGQTAAPCLSPASGGPGVVLINSGCTRGPFPLQRATVSPSL